MSAESSLANNNGQFCWVRTLPVIGDATVADETVLVTIKEELEPLWGGRPPVGVASKAVQSGDRAGAWFLVQSSAGRVAADTVFDIGPVFDKEECALKWLAGPDGQIWASEATNHCLLAFKLGVLTRAIEACPPKPSDPDRSDESHRFPDVDWSPGACVMPIITSPLHLLNIKGNGCEPPNHGNTNAECQQLMLLKHLRETPGINDAIRRQAHSLMASLQPVFKVLDIDLDKPENTPLRSLIATLQPAIDTVILHWKREYRRARPVHEMQEIAPMFPRRYRNRRHHLYPGHPAYPSGHATTAYVWAQLLASVHPKGSDLKPAFEAAAGRVAKNREIAGLHFASDSEAGRLLAGAVASELLSLKDFDLKKGLANLLA